MAQNSEISWTHHTANLWIGCTHVHEGCDHCYAEALAKRWGNDLWGNDRPRKAVKSVWQDLKRYQQQAAAAGEVQRVFVGSLMDIAEKSMPVIDHHGLSMTTPGGRIVDTGYLRALFYDYWVPLSPNLLFLLLSKRPGNYNKQVPDAWQESPPTNVMFGTSIVNPATVKTLLPQLKAVNGRRFLSVEPQLALINEIDLTGIEWVIVGGESGPRRRPFNPDWGRRLRDICAEQHVPFHFKQIDKVLPIPDDLKIQQFPNETATHLI